MTPGTDLLSSRFFWTAVLLLGVLPFSTARTLASKRAVVPTILSIITYVAWFACTAYSHGKGNLEASAGWTTLGSLWDDICKPFCRHYTPRLTQSKISRGSVRFHCFINCFPIQFVKGGTPESQAQDKKLPILQDAPRRVRTSFLCSHLPSGLLYLSSLLRSKSLSHNLRVAFFNGTSFPRRITLKHSQDHCELSYTRQPLY